MKTLLPTVLLLLASPLLQAGDSALQTRDSPYSAQETLDRLESVLQAKGIKVFARIDHSAEAQSAGLTLPPTQLLIFGSPKIGTPLMQQAPTTGLDLPMKVLVWEDESGRTEVTWTAPEALIQRHGLPAEAAASLGAIPKLVDAALK